jgi:hypothetical protein
MFDLTKQMHLSRLSYQILHQLIALPRKYHKSLPLFEIIRTSNPPLLLIDHSNLLTLLPHTCLRKQRLYPACNILTNTLWEFSVGRNTKVRKRSSFFVTKYQVLSTTHFNFLNHLLVQKSFQSTTLFSSIQYLKGGCRN